MPGADNLLAPRSFTRPRPSPVDEQVHFLVLFPTQGLTAHEAVLVPGHAAEIRPGPVLRHGNKAGYPGRGCPGRRALSATPVDLLQEGGHGAQVRVSHLLHQRDVIASQDLGEGPAGAGLLARICPRRPAAAPPPGPGLTCAMTPPQAGSDTLLSPKLWMLKAPMRSAAAPVAPSAQSVASRARGPPMARSGRARRDKHGPRERGLGVRHTRPPLAPPRRRSGSTAGPWLA